MSNPMVLMETSSGDILLELFEDKAPVTVANFLRYVDEEFYNYTIFHRVLKDFMIQGGGLGVRMDEKATHEPIQNEAGKDSFQGRTPGQNDELHAVFSLQALLWSPGYHR